MILKNFNKTKLETLRIIITLFNLGNSLLGGNS